MAKRSKSAKCPKRGKQSETPVKPQAPPVPHERLREFNVSAELSISSLKEFPSKLKGLVGQTVKFVQILQFLQSLLQVTCWGMHAFIQAKIWSIHVWCLYLQR
jgi:hypothetical protein